MDRQLNLAEMNLSPSKCEQMEEANARQEMLLVWYYFGLSGIISVPPWGTQDEFEDEKCIDSIWFIPFLFGK